MLEYIREYYKPETEKCNFVSREYLETQREKLEKKRKNIMNMRAEGELSKEDYAEMKAAVEAELQRLDEQEQNLDSRKDKAIVSIDEFQGGGDNPPLHKKSIISRILHRLHSSNDRRTPFKSFIIGFEEAKAFRKAQGSFLRANQWNDLTVAFIWNIKKGSSTFVVLEPFCGKVNCHLLMFSKEQNSPNWSGSSLV